MRLGASAAVPGAALLIAGAAALRPESAPAGAWPAAQRAAAGGLAWYRVQCRRSYRLLRKGEVWTPGLAVACLDDRRLARTR
jgi:hypothetical protein